MANRIWARNPFMRGVTFGGALGLMLGGELLVVLGAYVLGIPAAILGTFIFGFMLGEDSRD